MGKETPGSPGSRGRWSCSPFLDVRAGGCTSSGSVSTSQEHPRPPQTRDVPQPYCSNYLRAASHLSLLMRCLGLYFPPENQAKRGQLVGNDLEQQIRVGMGTSTGIQQLLHPGLAYLGKLGFKLKEAQRLPLQYIDERRYDTHGE